MTEIRQNHIKTKRIDFLDNLRTFMIFLVVLYHCGLVYENSGVAAFFWIVHDSSINSLSSIPNLMVIDIFIMSTIFFISGFLTPLSFNNKKGWDFLRSKFKRLMVPWIIAVLTLVPLYKVIFLSSRNLPQEGWTTYFHWNNGFISQNWLWFLPVLFLFDMLFFFLARLSIKPPLTLKGAIGAFFITGFAYSYCMDMFDFQGWTKTILLDFQNERLLIYFMVFLLGALCYRLRIFESGRKGNKLYVTVLCTAWIPIVLYRFLFFDSFIRPADFIFSKAIDSFLIWISFHLSLLGLLYLMINTFRYFLDKQGKITRELNNNSYQVYIIHVIVLGWIALAMLDTAIPSVLKFLILTVSTFVLSNLIVYGYRRFIKPRIKFKRREDAVMKTATSAGLLLVLIAIFGCGTEEKPVPSVNLHVAAIQGNIEAINQHIEAGSDLNEREPSRGSSPLITAAVFGRTEVAKALIEAGADVDYKNNEGSTALHSAAFFCRTEIVKMLLENGADKNSKNNAGRTPLESVSSPFDNVKGIYEGLGAALGPLGLQLDYEHIKITRPKIAALLE